MIPIGAIIQARMSSERLPGKTLRVVNNKPMLKYLLERLNHCENDIEIVVATSIDYSDNQISDFCSKHNILCYRGSLLNVAERFNNILKTYDFKMFIRINGDSPLLDQRLVDEGINIFQKGNYDIVTNVFPRTFPKGQSIEILDAKTFMDAFKKMNEEDDLEHVTKYMYRNECDYKIHNFESEKMLRDIQLSVDTVEDMLKFKQIIKSMNRNHWSYDYNEIINLAMIKSEAI